MDLDRHETPSYKCVKKKRSYNFETSLSISYISTVGLGSIEKGYHAIHKSLSKETLPSEGFILTKSRAYIF